jgi:hypothetical protein
LGEAMLEVGDFAQGPRGLGGGELVAQRGIALQDVRPGAVRRQIGRLASRNHEAGAHQAVIEGQGVHPAFLQEMVDGRLLVRIRPRWKIGESCHTFEMPEDQRGTGRRHWDAGDREVPRQEAARAGGVDQEVGLEADDLPLSSAREAPAAGRGLDVIQIHLFQDLDARLGRFQDEVVVHVFSQPVGIRDGVRGAGGYQHPALVSKGLAWFVAVEGEAPLEPTAEVGQPLHPASPGGEGVEVFLAIARGEALQADRGQGRGRLAQGEAGMAGAVEQ